MLMAAGAEVDEFNGAHVGGERPWVVPAMHQAARRMAPVAMAELLLDAGASATAEFEGVTPYSMARVYGNAGSRPAARGPRCGHRSEPGRNASGPRGGRRGKPGRIHRPCETAGGLSQPDPIASASALAGHDRPPARLVALGVPYDTPDGEGLTPVQIAGWEGLPDIMAYLLSLKPDLGHINGYGGTLLSTILHGSENNPARSGRDYVTCLRLALEEGVALPRRAMEVAGDEELAAFLEDWAEAHPGQVVEHGVV
jgi:hypothetical protein